MGKKKIYGEKRNKAHKPVRVPNKHRRDNHNGRRYQCRGQDKTSGESRPVKSAKRAVMALAQEQSI